MNVVAIIPARGGSKGIPRKNVRPLAGRPLVAHSIEQARATPEVSRVVVSTDDAAIARVAEEYGAEVVVRPPELSGDAASSESALLHALDTLRDREGWEPELVVFLQATSPIRRPGEISRAIHALLHEGADSLFSAVPVHGFVWRRERGARELRSFSYDHTERPRRQDAPEDFVENGSIYVFRPWVLRRLGNRLGGRIAMHVMGAAESFQVDEPGDLELMERLLATSRFAPRAPELGGIRLVALDFDGVLTDNRVVVSEDGRESVTCHRGDGWGIARLREAGVDVVVLSTETNGVVRARSAKLRIPCVDACDDKLAALRRIAAERGADPSRVAYVGNDVNDLPCLRWVGVPIVVADAEPEVRGAAVLVTSRAGGRGAVREVAEWILAARRAAVTSPATGGTPVSGGA